MSKCAIEITWAGGKHVFDLASPRVRWMLKQDQRPFPGQYGDTPAACFKRFDEKVYAPNDVEQIIRIGLIGGGQSPQAADALIAEHVAGQPVVTNAMLANAVLTRFFIGDAADADASA